MLASAAWKEEALSRITHAGVTESLAFCSSGLNLQILLMPWPLEPWISPSLEYVLFLLDIDSYSHPAYKVLPGLAVQPSQPPSTDLHHSLSCSPNAIHSLLVVLGEIFIPAY